MHIRHTGHVSVHSHMPHVGKARVRRVKVRAHTRKVRLRQPKIKAPPSAVPGTLGALASEPDAYTPMPDEGGDEYAEGDVDQDMQDEGDTIPADAGTAPTPTLGSLGGRRRGRV